MQVIPQEYTASFTLIMIPGCIYYVTVWARIKPTIQCKCALWNEESNPWRL